MKIAVSNLLVFADSIKNSQTEKILLLCFNSAKQVIYKKIFSQHKSTHVRFTARTIFTPVLKNNCTHIVLVHNHPSGRVFPSDADYITTMALFETAQLLEIKLIDHLIVSREDYFSFCEAGIL